MKMPSAAFAIFERSSFKFSTGIDDYSLLQPSFFLSEALGSALTRSRPRVKIVVLDRGLTDHILGLAAFYLGRCSWQENQKLSAACNTGRVAARGS